MVSWSMWLFTFQVSEDDKKVRRLKSKPLPEDSVEARQEAKARTVYCVRIRHLDKMKKTKMRTTRDTAPCLTEKASLSWLVLTVESDLLSLLALWPSLLQPVRGLLCTHAMDCYGQLLQFSPPMSALTFHLIHVALVLNTY